MDTKMRSKDSNPRPRKRRRENDGPNKVSQAKLKKRIRDVKRLLKREGLKANVREDSERALKSLKHQLSKAEKSAKEQKMEKRYHMVRFVERQKATRRLRQAEKLYKENPTLEAQEEIDKYTLDLYYTTHFPLTEKYVALYPKSEIESQEVLDRREQIRQQLRDVMLHGKKKISGSNKVQLGARKGLARTGGASSDGKRDEDEDEDVENIEIAEEVEEFENGEDEYFDFGH